MRPYNFISESSSDSDDCPFNYVDPPTRKAKTTTKSRVSVLPAPITSSASSLRQNSRDINPSSTPFKTITTAQLLQRSATNCPTHLSDSQRTTWFKQGRKAQRNQALLSSLSLFNQPTTSYDGPIFIHSRQTTLNIQAIIHSIDGVQIFTIDTESDRSTRDNPTTVPALLQIQAVYNPHRSLVLLIEVQHLPDPSTSLFVAIRTLCHTIFSPTNQIMSWGPIDSELLPFQHFNLFDLSRVVNHINLQADFATQWNKRHPHTSSCLDAKSQPTHNYHPSIELICSVPTDDLDSDRIRPVIVDDFINCLCPDDHRPYKSNTPLWSLQKAVQLTLNLALDKSSTLNRWSCGLDPLLHNSTQPSINSTLHELVLYAINDLFAPTQLYFHFHPSIPSQSISTNTPLRISSIITPTVASHSSISTSSISSNPTVPNYFLLADSNGRSLPSILHHSQFKLTTHAISGLQWYNPFTPHLCARALVQKSSISSTLRSCDALLFLIGTNSVRCHSAENIIQQVTALLSIIRQQHPHLSHPTSIIIIDCLPCLKPSHQFFTVSSLTSNISQYNLLLQSICIQLGFHLVTSNINSSHLGSDLLHIDRQFQPLLRDTITNLLQELSSKQNQLPSSLQVANVDHLKSSPTHLVESSSSSSSSPLINDTVPQPDISSPLTAACSLPAQPIKTQSQTRSSAANQLRNKRKHAKLTQKRRSNVLKLKVHRFWSITQLKAVLDSHLIQYGRVCPPINGIVRIQFNNPDRLLHAETTLQSDVFDEKHYLHWIATHS